MSRRAERTPHAARAAVGALLALVLVAAAALRLVEPLTNGVMAAQDPYMHLAHTRSVLEDGSWPLKDRGGLLPRPHYPPGLHALFGATVAVTGWDRYEAARFAPAAFGVLAAAAAFFLAARHLTPRDAAPRDAFAPAAAGGLVAAAFVATAPEFVFRGNLLQPSALDEHLVPLLLLAFVAAVRATAGSRAGWIALTIASLGALLLVHPWVAGLLAPPLFLYVLLERGLSARARLAAAAGAGALALAGLAFILSANYFLLGPDRVLERLGEIWSDPATELAEMPQLVNYPDAFGLPLIVLAAAGAVYALWSRRGAAALGLALTAVFIPLTRVDWLGLWYLPHRTLLYAAFGLALLAGAAAAGLTELVPRLARRARPAARPALATAVALLVSGTALGAGVAEGDDVGLWYHLYDEPHHGAAQYLEEHADHVVLGSWEGRWLVRAITDVPWTWSKPFFRDAESRNATLERLQDEGHEDIHMLIDIGVWIGETGRRGPPYDLEFRKEPEWKLVYEVEGILIYEYAPESREDRAR